MPAWKSFLLIRLPVAFAVAAVVLTGFMALLVVWLVDENSINTWDYASLRHKQARLEKAGRPPHLVVFGASGTYFGIDSQTLSEQLGMPVTNMATQVGKTLFFGERAVEHLIPGDVLFVPAEYALYGLADKAVVPFESCLLISHERWRLKTTADWALALARCPNSMLLYGMFLRTVRGLGANDFAVDMSVMENEYGDMQINTPAAARPPAEGVVSSEVVAPTRMPISAKRLEMMFQRARERGAMVVLSFPPQLAWASDVSPEWLRAHQAWAEANGAVVISHPREHRFPAECFFNSAHLHRGCARRNSLTYVDGLRSVLHRLSGGAPAPTAN